MELQCQSDGTMMPVCSAVFEFMELARNWCEKKDRERTIERITNRLLRE